MSGLIDVATVARAKGLPADALRAFGVTDRPEGGVRIEYVSPEAHPVRARVRLALSGPKGSCWDVGDLPITAYWRPTVVDLVRQRGVLLLCEGESSCWTAWHTGFGAIGVPGADQVATITSAHLASVPRVVLIAEPDDPQTYPAGRERFLAEVGDRLRALEYRGAVTTLDLDGVADDINALYRSDPSSFVTRMTLLTERSCNLDDLAKVVRRTRRLIGCGAPDVPAGVDVASWLDISRFAEATGDENPLYTDVKYGASSAHSTMLAPPAFVLAVRMPDSAGALETLPSALVDTVTRLQIVWDDNIRLGDRLHGRVWITDVAETGDAHEHPSARVTSSVEYARDDLGFARGQCDVSVVPLSRAPLSARPIYRYSTAEIDELVARLDAEAAPRGERPRFWSGTEVGEELPAVVAGPLTFSDLAAWLFGQSRPMPAGNLHYEELLGRPGRRAANPLTGWTAWDRTEGWIDSATSSATGLSAPAAPGGLLFGLAGRFVGYWMGDDAFLRRLSVRLTQHLHYGDALTLRGTVADRFVATDEASHRFHAVLIELWGQNQLGEPVMSGEAAVLLPEPGKPVILPIRGTLACEPTGRD